MRGIENAPFGGIWEKIGPATTADSVVGRIKGRDWVVKWSRRVFDCPIMAYNCCQLVDKSVNLYEAVFGKDQITPTYTLVGQKVDGSKRQYKVYIAQHFIDGWEGDILPQAVCSEENLLSSWEQMYQQMAKLIKVSRVVNSNFPVEQRFPINITVGSTRKMVKATEDSCPIPSSPNLIVERSTHRIKLFDFGSYEVWSQRMAPAYKAIVDQFC